MQCDRPPTHTCRRCCCALLADQLPPTSAHGPSPPHPICRRPQAGQCAAARLPGRPARFYRNGVGLWPQQGDAGQSEGNSRVWACRFGGLGASNTMAFFLQGTPTAVLQCLCSLHLFCLAHLARILASPHPQQAQTLLMCKPACATAHPLPLPPTAAVPPPPPALCCPPLPLRRWSAASGRWRPTTGAPSPIWPRRSSWGAGSRPRTWVTRWPTWGMAGRGSGSTAGEGGGVAMARTPVATGRGVGAL